MNRDRDQLRRRVAEERTGTLSGGNPVSAVSVTGDAPWVEFDLHAGTPLEIDRIDLVLRKNFEHAPTGTWRSSAITTLP